MTVLTSWPYSLTLGSTVVATAEALNAIGYSIPSTANTVGAEFRT